MLGEVARFADLATPCPVPDLPPMAERVAGWALSPADLPPDLDRWEVRHLDRIVSAPDQVVGRGGLAGDTLVHVDLRADNLLVTPAGSLVLLDRPWACVGPDWVDTVLLALDMAVHGGSDPARLVAGLPGVAAADPRDVTDLLIVLTGMWAGRMHRPAPRGLPTLRLFQRRFHDAALAWVQQRDTAGPG